MRNLHRMKVYLGITILFLAAVVTLGCEPDRTKQARADRSGASSFELNGNADAGKATYQAQCASCHGDDGKGQGPAGRALNPSPTDFTTAKMTEARSYKIVKEGGMSEGLAPTMPPFERVLDDQQLRDVVAYLHSFSR